MDIKPRSIARAAPERRGCRAGSHPWISPRTKAAFPRTRRSFTAQIPARAARPPASRAGRRNFRGRNRAWAASQPPRPAAHVLSQPGLPRSNTGTGRCAPRRMQPDPLHAASAQGKIDCRQALCVQRPMQATRDFASQGDGTHPGPRTGRPSSPHRVTDMPPCPAGFVHRTLKPSAAGPDPLAAGRPCAVRRWTYASR